MLIKKKKKKTLGVSVSLITHEDPQVLQIGVVGQLN